MTLVFQGTFEELVKSRGGLRKYKPMIGGVSDPGGKTLKEMIAESGLTSQDIPWVEQLYGGGMFPSSTQPTQGGDIGGLSSFGLTGEIEKARLDILERMKRTTDSRAKSRLTLPRLFGDGKTEQNILADIL